jgi:DNA-binding CsgD family transcriptional regulator
MLPAEAVTLNDLGLRRKQAELVELLDFDGDPEDSPEPFWDHFPNTPSCSYTEGYPKLRREVMRTSDFGTDRQWPSSAMYSGCFAPAGLDQGLIMPLPGPPGIARRLVFSRAPGQKFSERNAAVLLQPHTAEVLRLQARRFAAQRLTPRQLELLRLVALGHGNNAIARALVVSPLTVRKHLENINTRLMVTSRTAAVAFPDLTWS